MQDMGKEVSALENIPPDKLMVKGERQGLLLLQTTMVIRRRWSAAAAAAAVVVAMIGVGGPHAAFVLVVLVTLMGRHVCTRRIIHPVAVATYHH